MSCSIRRCEPFWTTSLSTILSCGSGFRCRILSSPPPGYARSVCGPSPTGTGRSPAPLAASATSPPAWSSDESWRSGASVDGLTGCLNRSATFELLDLALRQPSTAESGMAVIFVDLDRFKEVNDQFGHAAGDHALTMAADQIPCRGPWRGHRGPDRRRRVPRCLPRCDSSPEAALPVARRVAESMRLSITIAEEVAPIQLGASVGVAWTNRPSLSPDALLPAPTGPCMNPNETIPAKSLWTPGPNPATWPTP